jgi:hypothetical protein
LGTAELEMEIENWAWKRRCRSARLGICFGF